MKDGVISLIIRRQRETLVLQISHNAISAVMTNREEASVEDLHSIRNL